MLPTRPTQFFLHQTRTRCFVTQVSPTPYCGDSYENVAKKRSKVLFPLKQNYYKTPLLIHEGKMQYLFDHDGNKYLDFFAGIVTVSVGHCHPRVNKALEEQIKKLWHTTNIYMHPKLHEYAERLVETFPGKLKVLYLTNSGSEANDLALLLARLHTNNQDIISLRNGYHGGVASVLPITALNTWRYPTNNFNTHHAMNPDVYHGIYGGSHCRDSPSQSQRVCSCPTDSCEAAQLYYDQVKEIFEYSLPKGKLAGFIAESIQGVGGCVQYPVGYLKKVYELVREHGGVCIADEVQTGFGRTGDDFWGFQGHDVVPDIVTLAKGMGNGFPMGGVVTTPEIAESFKSALHFNTFGGNPLASVVGLEVLKIIEDEKLQENCKITGSLLINKLSELRDKYSVIGDVRGKGLMVGVEMVQDKQMKTPIKQEHMADIFEDCKNMGLLVGKGGLHGTVFRIKPPMCITKENVEFAVNVFEQAMKNHVQKTT